MLNIHATASDPWLPEHNHINKCNLFFLTELGQETLLILQLRDHACWHYIPHSHWEMWVRPNLNSIAPDPCLHPHKLALIPCNLSTAAFLFSSAWIGTLDLWEPRKHPHRRNCIMFRPPHTIAWLQQVGHKVPASSGLLGTQAEQPCLARTWARTRLLPPKTLLFPGPEDIQLWKPMFSSGLEYLLHKQIKQLWNGYIWLK